MRTAVSPSTRYMCGPMVRGWLPSAELLARGVGELTVEAEPSYPFEQAADALARARSGGNGKGMVLSPLRL